MSKMLWWALFVACLYLCTLSVGAWFLNEFSSLLAVFKSHYVLVSLGMLESIGVGCFMYFLFLQLAEVKAEVTQNREDNVELNAKLNAELNAKFTDLSDTCKKDCDNCKKYCDDKIKDVNEKHEQQASVPTLMQQGILEAVQRLQNDAAVSSDKMEARIMGTLRSEIAAALSTKSVEVQAEQATHQQALANKDVEIQEEQAAHRQALAAKDAAVREQQTVHHKALADKDAQIKAAQNEIAATRAQSEAARKQIETELHGVREKQIADVQEERAAHEQAIAEKDARIEAVQAELASARAELTSTRTQVETANVQERAAHEKTLADKDDLVMSTREELLSARNEIDSVRTHAESVSRNVHEKQAAIIKLKDDDIASLQAEMKVKDNGATVLHAQIKTKDNELASLRAQVKTKEDSIVSLQNAAATEDTPVKAQLALALKSCEEKDVALAKHAESSEELDSLRQQVDTLKVALASKANDQPGVASEIPQDDDLLQEIVDLKTSLASTQLFLDNAEKVNEEMEREWHNVHSAITTVTQRLPYVLTKVGKAQNPCHDEVIAVVNQDDDCKHAVSFLCQHPSTNLLAVKLKDHEMFHRPTMKMRRVYYELEIIFEHHRKFLLEFGKELVKKYPDVPDLAVSVAARLPAPVATPVASSAVSDAPTAPATSAIHKQAENRSDNATKPTLQPAAAVFISAANPLGSTIAPPTVKKTGDVQGATQGAARAKPTAGTASSTSAPKKTGGMMGNSKYAVSNYVPPERPMRGLETLINAPSTPQPSPSPATRPQKPSPSATATPTKPATPALATPATVSTPPPTMPTTPGTASSTPAPKKTGGMMGNSRYANADYVPAERPKGNGLQDLINQKK
jgi:hypothetical protein